MVSGTCDSDKRRHLLREAYAPDGSRFFPEVDHLIEAVGELLDAVDLNCPDLYGTLPELQELARALDAFDDNEGPAR